MTMPSDDAQREMQQRALRNVRGLVDKIESEDVLERASQRRVVLAVLVTLVVAAAAIVVWLGRSEADLAPRATVIDPAKLPPIKPGPASR
jgi:hypothetical protein